VLVVRVLVVRVLVVRVLVVRVCRTCCESASYFSAVYIIHTV